MKILFCTNSFEKTSNGPAKFAQLLLRNAVNHGFEVRILTEDINQDTKQIYKINIPLNKFTKPLSQFIRMFLYFRKSQKIKKEYKYDLIVYNNAIIGLASCLMNVPCVGMINDDNNSNKSLNNLFNKEITFSKHILSHYLEKLFTHIGSLTIVNSNYLHANLQFFYSTPYDKLAILRKGIEKELISLPRKELIKNKRAKSILFVKNDFIRGGLFDVLEAIALLPFDVVFTVIGPPIEYHSQIRSKVPQNCKSFFLYDYLPQKEIFSHMCINEVFCVPSHKEAFGVANLEAMAHGCKIVTSNIGGIPEAVGTNIFSNFLVQSRNISEISLALEKAFSTNIELSLDSIDMHLKNFSEDEVIKNFKKICEQLIKKHSCAE